MYMYVNGLFIFIFLKEILKIIALKIVKLYHKSLKRYQFIEKVLKQINVNVIY